MGPPSPYLTEGMDTQGNTCLQKTLLKLFLASVAINASLGIWTLLLGEFGETQGKVLTTSFFVSAAMLAILVNAVPLKKRILWPLPSVSAASAAAGFLLFVVVIWAEVESDWLPKLAVSSLVVGAGGTLIGLLQLLTARSILGTIRLVAALVIFLLCATTIVALWSETDSDWVFRLIGVEGVLTAALTLALPIASRLRPTMPGLSPEGVIRFCPSCGQALPEDSLFADPLITCTACGLGFAVRIQVPADSDPARNKMPGEGQGC